MEDCRPESAYRALASTLTEFSGRADWSLSAKPSYPRHTLGCRHNINPCRLSRATTSHRSDLIGASAGQVANLNRIFTPRGCPSIRAKALSRQKYPGRCVSTAFSPERLKDQDSGISP